MATSNIKNQHTLPSLSLNNVEFHLRDGPFESDMGRLTSQPTMGTHWVAYINENFWNRKAALLLKNCLGSL